MPVFIAGMPAPARRSSSRSCPRIPPSPPAASWFLARRRQRLANSEIRLLEAGVLAKAAGDYRAARAIGPEALRVTDKAPGNFELLWLIGLALPNARIIHCRRSPIDTCLSISSRTSWRVGTRPGTAATWFFSTASTSV